MSIVTLGLLWLWVARRSADAVVETVFRQGWLAVAVGLLAFISVPILALILFGISILTGTWSVPIVLLAAYLIGVSAAGAIVAMALGDWLLRRTGQPVARWIGLLLGAAIVAVLTVLPFIGWLFTFAVVLVGLGAAILAAFRGMRQPAAMAVA